MAHQCNTRPPALRFGGPIKGQAQPTQKDAPSGLPSN